MIFITVGTDLPFDRLIRALDHWAGESGRRDVFAQIGDGGWEPKNIEFAHFIEPAEFKERFQSADIVIAHAGMGTILSALQSEKPILVMPRRASLGEQRNEHQLATARRMQELEFVSVAFNDEELQKELESIESLEGKRSNRIGQFAGENLIGTIRHFINAK